VTEDWHVVALSYRSLIMFNFGCFYLEFEDLVNSVISLF